MWNFLFCIFEDSLLPLLPISSFNEFISTSSIDYAKYDIIPVARNMGINRLAKNMDRRV